MMLKLEDVTNLGEQSPLQDWLKEVDGLVKYQQGWAEIHRILPVERIYGGLLQHLGHPKTNRQVDEDQVRAYAHWLEDNGEPTFSGILNALRLRGVAPKCIRMTMIFIVANLEYLKEREAQEGRSRSIDDGSAV